MRGFYCSGVLHQTNIWCNSRKLAQKAENPKIAEGAERAIPEWHKLLRLFFFSEAKAADRWIGAGNRCGFSQAGAGNAETVCWYHLGGCGAMVLWCYVGIWISSAAYLPSCSRSQRRYITLRNSSSSMPNQISNRRIEFKMASKLIHAR